MSDEKPLHVLVAEALGWTEVQYAPSVGAYGRSPERSGGLDGHGILPVPDFSADWSAAGPLIEKFWIELTRCSECEWVATRHETMWQYNSRRAALPLIAVCNLVLALKAEGKLCPPR